MHTHFLDVNLDVLLQTVAIQVENEVMDEVEAITYDNEGQLVGEFGLFEEVLHSLGVVTVALSTDALHLMVEVARVRCVLLTKRQRKLTSLI